MLRKELQTLVERLAASRARPDADDERLPPRAQGAGAADAGLDRVNVSLDSLDDATFRAMNDVDFPVDRVLEGIDAAAAVGLAGEGERRRKRGVNDVGVVEMARYFRGTGHTLRFIEYMDVGTTNGWRLDDVVPAAEIVERIGAVFPLEAVEAANRGEVAQRWRYRGRRGRDRRDLVGDAALLRRLHAVADLGGGEALHVSLREPRHGSPCAAALGRER